jgi:IclR-like helix-turn-helix domain-containing protein
MQTSVFICEYRAMTNDEQRSITITLSPTQIDEVVRGASRSRAPSLSTLITRTLGAAKPSEIRVAPGPASAPPAEEAQTLGGYVPIDDIDRKLSRSLMRGLSILTCFGPGGRARGIVELARDLGMSPSTTHRYASTLVELGLLERCPTTRKYRLPGT